MSRAAGNLEASASSWTIPEIVREAGEGAVCAYRHFFDNPVRSAGTRKLYRVRAGRFFRWAEAGGMTLEAIDADALAAYAAMIAFTKSRHEAALYLTPVRGVLRHLARSGILAADPCPRGQPNGRNNETTAGRPAPAISLSELKRIVLRGGEEDGWEEGCAEFRAGLVLLAPLAIDSMDPAAVAGFTGVPEPEVREYALRLVANEIWRDGGIALAGEEDLAFMLAVWVALGELESRCEAGPDQDGSGFLFRRLRPGRSGLGMDAAGEPSSGREEPSDA